MRALCAVQSATIALLGLNLAHGTTERPVLVLGIALLVLALAALVLVTIEPTKETRATRVVGAEPSPPVPGWPNPFVVPREDPSERRS